MFYTEKRGTEKLRDDWMDQQGNTKKKIEGCCAARSREVAWRMSSALIRKIGDRDQ